MSFTERREDNYSSLFFKYNFSFNHRFEWEWYLIFAFTIFEKRCRRCCVVCLPAESDTKSRETWNSIHNDMTFEFGDERWDLPRVWFVYVMVVDERDGKENDKFMIYLSLSMSFSILFLFLLLISIRFAWFISLISLISPFNLWFCTCLFAKERLIPLFLGEISFLYHSLQNESFKNRTTRHDLSLMTWCRHQVHFWTWKERTNVKLM